MRIFRFIRAWFYYSAFRNYLYSEGTKPAQTRFQYAKRHILYRKRIRSLQKRLECLPGEIFTTRWMRVFGGLRDTEMKKKCKGCRALQKKLLGIGYYCGLNHPIKATSEIDGIPVEYKPLEECEKPKTITGYCSLHLEQTRQTIKRFS